MAKVERLERVVRALEGQRLKKNRPSVIVGYTQRYALPVHENTRAQHAPGKQAKYLETPARYLQGELARIVTQVYRQTGDMERALLVAGLRLQRESQKIVPIDTGALKASAFTRAE